MENGVSALIEVGIITDQSSSQNIIDLDKDSSSDDHMNSLVSGHSERYLHYCVILFHVAAMFNLESLLFCVIS